MKFSSKLVRYIIMGVTIFFLVSYKYINTNLPEPFRSIYIAVIYIFFGILFLSYLNLLDKEKANYTPYVDIFNRLTTILMFVILISPAIIYILVLVFRVSQNAIVYVSNEDTWIGFLGSIIGGVLTMIAVIFTFNLQKISNEMENDKTRIPRLIIETINQNNEPSKLRYFVQKEDDIYAFFDLEMILRNVSEFPAKNIKIKNCELKIYDLFHTAISNEVRYLVVTNIEIERFNELNTQPFFGGYTAKFSLPIKVEKSYLKTISSNTNVFCVDISFEYNSLFNRLKYVLHSNFNFTISKPKIEKLNRIRFDGQEFYVDLSFDKINNFLNIVE